jgi:hypothetical protein
VPAEYGVVVDGDVVAQFDTAHEAAVAAAGHKGSSVQMVPVVPSAA